MAGSKGSGKDVAPRRGYGLRHAGEATRDKLSAAASRYGFAEPDILLRWQEIAGAETARLCTPVKVTYGTGFQLGATLVVRAEGAVAPQVEHMSRQILERVNQHYGYRAISRLRVTQAVVAQPGFAEPAVPFDPPRPASARERAISADAQERASRLASSIKHPELRAAITELGAQILSQPAEGDPKS
ncbi:MAG: DUF721 domain-containing protein [Pseudomonadota bacterium]